VVGNVDKTFADYIIIAKTNARERRFAAFHIHRKFSIFIQSPFLAGQEEFYYEKSH
jgi:hypothetical protein